MYKMRIKQWGLDKKNNKENEMRAIVHKNKQRLDQGKPSVYRTRDRQVDYADVVRYFNRKKISIDDVIARRTGSATPEAVECFTPVLSPATLRAVESFTPVLRPIMTPQVLAIPERIFASIWVYFQGSFESGTWKSTGEGFRHCQTTKVPKDGLSRLSMLSDQCLLACRLFANESFSEAGKTLISATAGIKKILLAEDPGTLLSLFGLITEAHRHKRNEIALAILRQYSAMAEVLLGSEHPLCYISGWLTSVDPSQSNDVIGRCKESVADHFEILIGPMHRSTLNARMISIEDRTRKEEWLQDFLGKCENDMGSLDPRIWEVRYELALHCFYKHKYLEAKKSSQELLAQAQYPQLMRMGVNYQTDSLYIIALSQHALGETKSAESTLREAIDLSGSKRQGRAMFWLTILEGWLLEKGQRSSAAQVKDRRRKVLESINPC